MDGKRGHDMLLVEDDPGDAGLVRIALGRSSRPCRLHHVRNAEEAMAFLRGSPPHGLNGGPDLVLLDLNLPGRGGHEILENIRADSRLTCLPVVVLSTSGAERDVRRAYALGANGYVVKPMEAGDFVAAIHSIQDFWFGTARLPERSG